MTANSLITRNNKYHSSTHEYTLFPQVVGLVVKVYSSTIFSMIFRVLTIYFLVGLGAKIDLLLSTHFVLPLLGPPWCIFSRPTHSGTVLRAGDHRGLQCVHVYAPASTRVLAADLSAGKFDHSTEFPGVGVTLHGPGCTSIAVHDFKEAKRLHEESTTLFARELGSKKLASSKHVGWCWSC